MFGVLTVCTANICRSPLAQLELTARLDAQRFSVSSAGLRGFVDAPMDPSAARQAQRFGLDPRAFRSRRLAVEHVEAADLVLTATRDHRSALLDLVPTALRRTFTLTEFADLAARASAESLAQLVAAAAADRSRSALMSADELDIADPYGAPYEVHARVATRIHQACLAIAYHLGRVA